MKPIALVLGPSGAGKTTLGDALADHAGMLHLNFDRPDGNGVDREGLRAEWDAFLNDRDPQPLADSIRGRVVAAGKVGAAVTCPSGIVPCGVFDAVRTDLPREYVLKMREHGIRCLVLYGSLVDCMGSFLARDAWREDVAKWWCDNNGAWYTRFRRDEFDDCVIPAFAGGRHRPLHELLDDARRRTLD